MADPTTYNYQRSNYLKEHTYIFGRYNPSVRVIDLVSHTDYVVCVNFIHKWRELQFKVDTERQVFFLHHVMAILVVVVVVVVC